jgi:hypothetical protein
MSVRLCGLFLLMGLGAVNAQAQVLRGRVVAAGDARPIPGALVELQDSVGRPLQRALTTTSGTFRFVPGRSGAYRVRVAAIGYTIHPVASITIAGGDAQLPDFQLEAAVAILPDLVAAGKRRMCGLEILDDPLFGRLLEGAKASLAVMEQGIGLGTTYAVEEVRTRTLTNVKPPRNTADTTRGELTKWPLESVNPALLRAEGFARLLAPEEGKGRVYYGPDLRVLFADWFLESHCFAFDAKPREGDTRLVRLTYEPKSKGKLVDVAGDLLIDATTLSLRELTFVHRHLPGHIKSGAAGGMVAFANLEDGGWLPVRWRIYGPVESSVTEVRVTRSVSLGARRQSIQMPPRVSVTGSVELVGRVLGTGGEP